MMGSKQCQMYIFVAIILCASLVAIFAGSSKLLLPTYEFSSLKKNFVAESSSAVNLALQNSSLNMSEEHDKFIDSYLAYAKTRDASFRLLSVLNFDGSTKINNVLDLTVNVTTPAASYSLLKNENITISNPGTVNISLALGTNTYFYIFNTIIKSKEIKQQGIFLSQKGYNIRIDREG